MRVYVAGPYTKGDRSENVRRAMTATIELMDAGHEPFCPILSHFLDLFFPRPWGEWLRVDLAWVEVSEALVKLPGESVGADREAVRAETIGIPVYHSVEGFLGCHA